MKRNPNRVRPQEYLRGYDFVAMAPVPAAIPNRGTPDQTAKYKSRVSKVSNKRVAVDQRTPNQLYGAKMVEPLGRNENPSIDEEALLDAKFGKRTRESTYDPLNPTAKPTIAAQKPLAIQGPVAPDPMLITLVKDQQALLEFVGDLKHDFDAAATEEKKADIAQRDILGLIDALIAADMVDEIHKVIEKVMGVVQTDVKSYRLLGLPRYVDHTYYMANRSRIMLYLSSRAPGDSPLMGVRGTLKYKTIDQMMSSWAKGNVIDLEDLTCNNITQIPPPDPPPAPAPAPP